MRCRLSPKLELSADLELSSSSLTIVITTADGSNGKSGVMGLNGLAVKYKTATCVSPKEIRLCFHSAEKSRAAN